jgi:membrane fusion protein (multidrug efflux system)
MKLLPLFSRPLSVTLLGATVAAVSCSSGTATTTAAPPPVSVSVLDVKPERVTLSSEWIATLDGLTNAQIRPQVSGYLLSRQYQEGGYVRKGQLLFEIDPRPFEATLAQAKARLAESQAQLSKADRDLKRDTPLAEQRAIPQSQLDNDVEARSASVAAVQSAEAGLLTAQLNLDFTRVTSLIDGIAAIATAQIGDLVSPSTLLTTVSQVDPIKAYFPLSEPEYLRLSGLNRGAPDGGQTWHAGGLTLILADGTEYPQRGTFLATDREIDSKTGTIRVSASFPNATHVLRPGQFGRIRAVTQTFDDALLVPQRAVSELQGSSLVRVVGADNRVLTRNVVLGERVGNRWIVRTGLQSGDRIIVEAPALKDGAVVAPKPFSASGSR